MRYNPLNSADPLQYLCKSIFLTQTLSFSKFPAAEKNKFSSIRSYISSLIRRDAHFNCQHINL